MLLIDCPYCGERPELEFSYGGQAHLARPAVPPNSTIRHGPNFCTCAPTPRACTRSAGATRAAAGASSMRCATRPPIISWPSTRPAKPSRPSRSARTVGACRTLCAVGARCAAGAAQAHAVSEHGGNFRTPGGGRIDRARRVRFNFDGRAYEGVAGDTLASALLANGVHLTGRSFKYHRPRGIFAAGSEEPNALVTVSRDAARVTPNLRATQVELYDGLSAESQNRWPSLQRDFGRINDACRHSSRPAFTTRRSCGRARPGNRCTNRSSAAPPAWAARPRLADPDRYAQRYAHCDVLVVGAGPAGIAAALAAADGGARVILCDETSEFGGSLLVGRWRPHRRTSRPRLGTAGLGDAAPE